jgi:hypothetical protein
MACDDDNARALQGLHSFIVLHCFVITLPHSHLLVHQFPSMFSFVFLLSFFACCVLADRTWKEVVNAAYLDRVDLSAHGFYITPDITGFGGNRPFNYLCYVSGIACFPSDVVSHGEVLWKCTASTPR